MVVNGTGLHNANTGFHELTMDFFEGGPWMDLRDLQKHQIMFEMDM